jgi:hypothetical protein
MRQGREYLAALRDERTVYLGGETRAGMGVCQARDCGRQIEALVAQAAGVPVCQLVSP